MSGSTLGPDELARLTGVSTDTLRYYERRGLLPAPPRTAAGYRRYPASSVERVQLIRRALGRQARLLDTLPPRAPGAGRRRRSVR